MNKICFCQFRIAGPWFMSLFSIFKTRILMLDFLKPKWTNDKIFGFQSMFLKYYLPNLSILWRSLNNKKCNTIKFLGADGV